MERYRPKVIICKYCQIFGHVARVCENRSKGRPRCGKCANTDHQTKDCTIAQANFKCCHCEGNHITGDRECPKLKLKFEAISERSHNG